MANEAMQREFLSRAEEKFITKRARKRLERQTVKQQLSQARWAGIKAAFVYLCEERCWKCGAEGPVDLHHRVHRSQGGEDEPDNAQVLCRRCHDDAHGRPQFSVVAGSEQTGTEGGDFSLSQPMVAAPPPEGEA